MTRFLSRIAGASLLDAATHEDVEADRSTTIQAIVVVFLSSVAAGVGALGPSATHPAALVTVSVLAVSSGPCGARLMPSPHTRADVGQLLRTIGFASGMIRVLGIFPGMMVPAFSISAVWMLFAMIVGVRQALECTSTLRAATVCSISWLLSIGLAYAASALFVPALY